MLGIEERLSHREMRTGFDLGMESLDFVVKIVGDGIERHSDREIRGASESFPSPIRALIQPMQNFDQADGIDFVDAAGFRVIANRWRVARDGENVADAADRPCT